MTTQLSRTTVQFKTMGKCRQVPHLAFALLSRMQGSAVLAHALNDPSVVQESMRKIGQWIGREASPHRPKAI
jgi:hypothetical protein